MEPWRPARWLVTRGHLGAAVSFALYGIVNRPLVRRYRPKPIRPTRCWPAASRCWQLPPAALAALKLGRGVGAERAGIVYMVVLLAITWPICCGTGQSPGACGGGHQLLAAGANRQRRTLSAWLFAEPFGAAKLLGAALVLGGATIRTPARARTSKGDAGTLAIPAERAPTGA